MKKVSNFRIWVEMIWRENREERLVWHEDKQSLDQYFKKYKWWLRREFRHQQKSL